MSREPASGEMRYRDALRRTGGEPALPAPPPPVPKKPPRIRVEGVPKPQPEPDRERTFTKLATTTEALTADERRLLRELRQTDAENGRVAGATARRSVSAIRKAKKEKRR